LRIGSKRQKICQNTIREVLMKINRLLQLYSLLMDRRKRLMKNMLQTDPAKYQLEKKAKHY